MLKWATKNTGCYLLSLVMSDRSKIESQVTKLGKVTEKSTQQVIRTVNTSLPIAAVDSNRCMVIMQVEEQGSELLHSTESVIL